MTALRTVQILFVAYIGLFASVVAFSNFIDPQPNLGAVQHVLSMDTAFPGSTLRSRAITDPDFVDVAYLLIIVAEAVTGILCLAGSARLFRERNADATVFHHAKAIAFLGLGLAFTIWYLGFMVIAGEWFAMWQSARWNLQDAAMKPVICIGIVTILLAQKE